MSFISVQCTLSLRLRRGNGNRTLPHQAYQTEKTTQLPFVSLITLITMLIIAQPLRLLWIISPNSESAPAWVPVHEGVPLRPFDMQLAASSSVEPVRSSRQNSCSMPDCPFHRSVFDLAGDTGEGEVIYFFPVVQALVVVFQSSPALLLPLVTVSGIHNVATEDFLPEGKAAGGTCKPAGC